MATIITYRIPFRRGAMLFNVILALLYEPLLIANEGIEPPKPSQISRCFGKAAKNLLSTEAIIGKTKYYFFTWESCANGKAGFIWTVFERDDNQWEKIDVDVQFSEAWIGEDIEQNESFLIHYWPGSSTDGSFVVTRQQEEKLVQEKLADLSLASRDKHFFWNWLNKMPKININKRRPTEK